MGWCVSEDSRNSGYRAEDRQSRSRATGKFDVHVSWNRESRVRMGDGRSRTGPKGRQLVSPGKLKG